MDDQKRTSLNWVLGAGVDYEDTSENIEVKCWLDKRGVLRRFRFL